MLPFRRSTSFLLVNPNPSRPASPSPETSDSAEGGRVPLSISPDDISDDVVGALQGEDVTSSKGGVRGNEVFQSKRRRFRSEEEEEGEVVTKTDRGLFRRMPFHQQPEDSFDERDPVDVRVYRAVRRTHASRGGPPGTRHRGLQGEPVASAFVMFLRRLSLRRFSHTVLDSFLFVFFFQCLSVIVIECSKTDAPGHFPSLWYLALVFGIVLVVVAVVERWFFWDAEDDDVVEVLVEEEGLEGTGTAAAAPSSPSRLYGHSHPHSHLHTHDDTLVSHVHVHDDSQVGRTGIRKEDKRNPSSPSLWSGGEDRRWGRRTHVHHHRHFHFHAEEVGAHGHDHHVGHDHEHHEHASASADVSASVDLRNYESPVLRSVRRELKLYHAYRFAFGSMGIIGRVCLPLHPLLFATLGNIGLVWYFYLTVTISPTGGPPPSDVSLSATVSLSSGIALIIAYKTIGSTIDITLFTPKWRWYSIGIGAAVWFLLSLLSCLSLANARKARPTENQSPTRRREQPRSERDSLQTPLNVGVSWYDHAYLTSSTAATLVILGIFFNLYIFHFVFNSPIIISLYARALDYSVILFIELFCLLGYNLIATFSPRVFGYLRPWILLGFNVLMLVVFVLWNFFVEFVHPYYLIPFLIPLFIFNFQMLSHEILRARLALRRKNVQFLFLILLILYGSSC